MLKERVKKLSNWKAPGPDGVQGYWFKNLPALHPRLAEMINGCLTTGSFPKWLTKGTTVLIIKDKTKGGEVTNFRPITCLSVMWKLFTSILSESIYGHLDQNNLLPEEQKGCRKRSHGTKDQLLIDKMILRNCKRRTTNLAMGWVDYKKAFDMVPHSWIHKCLEIFGIAPNIQTALKNSMKNWETNLTSGGVALGKVKIRRGIFQGDSLSPLLFVISLIPMTLLLRNVKAGYELGKGLPTVNHLLFMDDLKVFGKNETQLDTLMNTVKLFSDDIRMEFGITKCAILVIKRGKLVHSDGLELPTTDLIKNVDSERGYKYLGILEADKIKNKEMKNQVTAEYNRRVRSILKSHLHSRNTIYAINARAVAIIRYTAGILDWNVDELKCLDTKTRKMLTIYGAFAKKGDADRLYLPRKEGGRGLLSVEDVVNIEEGCLYKYISESNEILLREVKREEILRTGVKKNQRLQERGLKLFGKKLHSVFFKNTAFRDNDSWNWLVRGDLKRSTESTLMAAQEQATRTRSIKHYIDKTAESPICRLCNEREETLAHIVSECPMLAQHQYKKWRHDKVAQVLHWNICKLYELDHNEKWYEHKPEVVQENDNVKLLWDMRIQTDKVLEHSKPDLIFLNKNKRTCLIIDIACPFDTRVQEKEHEKINKYQDLKWELVRLWKCKEVKVIPVVIGTLGTITKSHHKWLKQIDETISFPILQKACLLGTAKVLRYSLNI